MESKKTQEQSDFQGPVRKRLQEQKGNRQEAAKDAFL
jgi:hypothetical protein